MQIKDFINSLKDKLCIHMTAEQKMNYTAARAKYMLDYERFFLFFIIAFEVFNVAYALVYTEGRLYTTASRVYVALYTVLILVSLACLFFSSRFKKRIADKPQNVIHLQVFFGVFLLIWGACVTVYDQRVSENISVYMNVSLIVAMLVDFTPLQAALTYGGLQLLLFKFLPLLKDPTKDSYGENINLLIMTLMCIIISIYHYYNVRKHYLYEQIITERNAELKQIAYKDSLTGLKNRRFLEDEMRSLYEACFHARTPLSFMMLDIDSFKIYNDQYGHLQGDECLRRVTWRIFNTLERDHEHLIRYGGEEFLYIGVGVDEPAARYKAEYYNKIIRELVIGPSDQEPMGVTVSIGVYTVNWDEAAEVPASNWIDCVSEADKALYMAKNSGKDRCVCLAGRH